MANPLDRCVEAFDPLGTVLCYDDFDNGMNGWMPLTPNLREDALDYFPSQRRHIDWGAPMLSTATFGLAGTHGSRSGTYSLKIPTRAVAARAEELPVPGSVGIGIKRLTAARRQPIRFEMWYAISVEQDRPGIGENDFRAFGFAWDVQDQEHRYFAGVRYINSANGHLQQRWQYLNADHGTDEGWGAPEPSAVGHVDRDGRPAHTVYIKRGLGSEHLGRRDANGGGDGFVDVPGSRQEMCFNETVDKINWQYLSFTFDLDTREYLALSSMDRSWDLAGRGVTLVDTYPRLNCLLNPLMWVESDTNRRAFLFVDSVMISTGQEV